MAYNGNIELISGLKPKNDGNFPLINAKDIYVDDNNRLTNILNQIKNDLNELINQLNNQSALELSSTKYPIIKNIKGFSMIGGEANEVAENFSYSTKLTLLKSYGVPIYVSVFMDNEEITEDTYDQSTGIIYIPHVTGPVRIYAEAYRQQYSVLISGPNYCFFDTNCNNGYVNEGDPVSVTISYDSQQYKDIDMVRVRMNNVEISHSNSRQIYIPECTGNVEIEVTMIPKYKEY